MNKTYLVMKREIRTTLTRKSFLFFGFGLPLILAIVAVVIIIIGRDSVPDALVDSNQPNSAESLVEGYVDEGGLIKGMPEDIETSLLLAFEDTEAAQKALDAQDIDGYYIVSANYEQTGEIVYVKPSHDPLSGWVNTSGMEWILLYNLLDGDAKLAQSVLSPIRVEMTSTATTDGGSSEDSWIVELLPNIMSIFLYMVILIPAGILVAAVTDEKKNRVMEVLLISVSPRQMIVGKIVAVGILGSMMVLVWIGVIWGVASFGGQSMNIPIDFKLPPSLLIWAIIYAILGYAMYGSQMAGLGALAPDVKDTRSATFLVMGPIIITYVFLMIIVITPNGPIAVALSLFPLSGPVAMIARMSVIDVPIWQPIASAILQVLAAVFITIMVARLFKAQNMLSGRPFNVKDYYMAIIGRR